MARRAASIATLFLLLGFVTAIFAVAFHHHADHKHHHDCPTCKLDHALGSADLSLVFILVVCAAVASRLCLPTPPCWDPVRVFHLRSRSPPRFATSPLRT